MTPEETALAFAREILGWEDAREYASGWLDNGSGVGSPVFRYTDLNRVVEACEDWANRNRIPWFRLDYSMPDRNYYAKVHVGAFHGFGETRCQSPYPTVALMAACLTAKITTKEGL